MESFNGSVEVSTWDQQTVDISGTKYARTQADTSDIKIEIDHAPDSVAIRAVRPGMRRGNYGARFAIKVPRGAVLDRLVTSNGGIRADDGVGPARMKTSNGHVEVRAMKGPLTVETSNGPIEVQDVAGTVQAHTSNGHIRLDRVLGAVDAFDLEQQHTGCGGEGGRLDEAAKFQRADRSDAAGEHAVGGAGAHQQ